MKRTATLAIALGIALAVIGAGTASSVTLDLGGGVPVHVPTDGVLPACSDLSDNDGDGLVDTGDPGCGGNPLGASEYNAPPAPPGGGGAGGGGGGAGTAPGASGPGAPQVQPGKPGFKGKPGGSTGGILGPNGKGKRKKIEEPEIRNPDGSPTDANPTLTAAQFPPAPLGVPNFIIDSFEIPPFLLPIYQACGTQYGIPWQVLAAINKIETGFGTNLNVSSAGAVGWMQFLPSTWEMYGTDANNDNRQDPYNPVDAICAAARYLKAAGGNEDLRQGIFAYNHADWYVDEVLHYAQQYGKLPDSLVGSITGIAEGHFPIAAYSRYADDISEREAIERSRTSRTEAGNAADVISDSPTRRGIDIYSKVDAPVIAVNDGVIKAMGENEKLGKFIVLQDAYGNRYTYAELGSISEVHPVAKQRALTAEDFELVRPKDDPKPDDPASAGSNDEVEVEAATKPEAKGPANTEELRARLFANPERANNVEAAGLSGQLDALLNERVPAYETFKNYFSGVFRFDRRTMELRPLRVGSKVTGGTVLGRIGRAGAAAPHVHFAIRPAGRGTKKIDPKVILDGWKLREATAIFRAAKQDPWGGSEASIGQVLLMNKTMLQQRVLADPRIEIYACGRTDIESGQIDRRTLATLEYLAERGYRLTVTSLKCGHSFYTTSGSVSAHSSGNAVDIARVNGLPILGNQGPGSITEAVVRDLLKLQGTMRPAQIITLMEMGPPTFAMGDHDDHIHVGYTPLFGSGKLGQQLARVLKPDQWERLIDRLGEIDNPKVPVKPSKESIPVAPKNRSSDAHIGE